ncbi:hypothetical protein GUJ93_ZPchr0013g34945 [Zizania palustris]|uniref:Uncharacterized protein n=1 Tax=Zizania palustris TaxID=103762 RepID=A0A8J5X8Q9_ZIZPA|nr:hypothetical protein GUJ93_ZPchr0013g34945 [Zizania palustris]
MLTPSSSTRLLPPGAVAMPSPLLSWTMAPGFPRMRKKQRHSLIFFLYKMGFSNNPRMDFDLDHLIPRSQGLNHLGADISETELDSVIMSMHSDKAPGPDGFNGTFYKSC